MLETLSLTIFLWRYVACDIIESIHIWYIDIPWAYKIKCNYRVTASQYYLRYFLENIALGIILRSFRNSRPEVSLRKGVLKICNKFTGEHPCRSVVSIRLLCNFIKIALWHGCSPVNLLDILRTSFFKNSFGRLLLIILTPKNIEMTRTDM